MHMCIYTYKPKCRIATRLPFCYAEFVMIEEVDVSAVQQQQLDHLDVIVRNSPMQRCGGVTSCSLAASNVRHAASANEHLPSIQSFRTSQQSLHRRRLRVLRKAWPSPLDQMICASNLVQRCCVVYSSMLHFVDGSHLRLHSTSGRHFQRRCSLQHLAKSSLSAHSWSQVLE